MTPIAWALLGIVWGMLAYILMVKWRKINKKLDVPADDGWIIIACWLFLPVTMLFVIIWQTFLEDWK